MCQDSGELASAAWGRTTTPSSGAIKSLLAYEMIQRRGPLTAVIAAVAVVSVNMLVTSAGLACADDAGDASHALWRHRTSHAHPA